MEIKIVYNYVTLEIENSDFSEFSIDIWKYLEKEFGFSIRNGKYEFITDEDLNIKNVIISLNDKGYNQYKEWKYRMDRLESVLNNL